MHFLGPSSVIFCSSVGCHKSAIRHFAISGRHAVLAERPESELGFCPRCGGKYPSRWQKVGKGWNLTEGEWVWRSDCAWEGGGGRGFHLILCILWVHIAQRCVGLIGLQLLKNEGRSK